MSPRVLTRMEGHMQLLREGPPGERFQTLHRRRTGAARRRSARVGAIGGGVLLVAGGLITYPIPGPPSTLMVFGGAVLLAQEWLHVARLLDRLELRHRRSMAALRRFTSRRGAKPPRSRR